jgi:hypothetical protein
MANEPWVIKAPFYGKWSMKVTGKNSPRKQRMLIESTSGIEQTLEDVAVGQSIANIDFPLWHVVILSSDGGPGSNASRIRRVPGVIEPDGLIVTLHSDDVVGSGGDEDFNDLIAQFTYLNPEVNPAGVPHYPFNMPPGAFRPARPERDKPRHRCECVCVGRGGKRWRCTCGR